MLVAILALRGGVMYFTLTVVVEREMGIKQYALPPFRWNQIRFLVNAKQPAAIDILLNNFGV